METQELKERFIQLRAQGYSYDRAAKELGKAKQTLIDWSKELGSEIANRKALELDALYEKYYLYKEHRLQVFGQILARLREEALNRDLSDLPTDKLLDLVIKYNSQLKEEYLEPTFKSSEEIHEERLNKQLLEELSSISGSRKLKAV
jgi:hypothetical protein